ncbi:hypothetical protein TWF506_009139 [Arthrobotrys conoides]|uniref:Uncharacterized protein n=1 Tax=Arthrobotrys conoides TaxID=74498 RepID=A0AAN8NBX6_9PEZI
MATEMDLPKQLDEEQNILLMGKIYGWVLEDDMERYNSVKELKRYDALEDGHLF